MRRLRFFKRKIVWIPLAALLAVVLMFSFFRGEATKKNLAFSDVIAAARDGRLQSVEVGGRSLTIRLRGDDSDYESSTDGNTDIVRALQDAKATVGGVAPGAVRVSYHNSSPGWFSWVFWGGVLVVLGLIIYFAVLFALRRAQKQSD